MGLRPSSWLAPIALLGALLLPSRGGGGDWHRDRTLVCSDCHTMHNSKGGRPMRFDEIGSAAGRLLRGESATSVCLACHRGDRPGVKAPSVTAPSNWDPPGGGFPADLSDPAHHAHAIGTAALLPPEGDTPVVLGCGTCHEIHGNGAYRNLRADPSGAGRGTPAPQVNQLKPAGTAPLEQVYVRTNVRYLSGMSQWCMDCHNLIQPTHAASAEVSLASHPWDVPIYGAAAADYAGWSNVLSNRVPVQNAFGAPAPDHADKVFCLSCHKAHGSPNDAALINADGATRSSTCQQCHNV
jgi:predicted CXXCH cytochrome family protein